MLYNIEVFDWYLDRKYQSCSYEKSDFEYGFESKLKVVFLGIFGLSRF